MDLLLWILREGVRDDSEEEVQEEKGAHHHEDWEVDTCNWAGGVKVVVHVPSPTFECDHPKDGQDGWPNVIKLKVAVLYLLPLIYSVSI